MNVSCYAIEVKPNNSTKRLGVKFINVNVYEQIFRLVWRMRQGKGTNQMARTVLLDPLSSVKVKEKREEIIYLYDERNLKEILEILIYEI